MSPQNEAILRYLYTAGKPYFEIAEERLNAENSQITIDDLKGGFSA